MKQELNIIAIAAIAITIILGTQNIMAQTQKPTATPPPLLTQANQ
jgi:hypothetical protein